MQLYTGSVRRFPEIFRGNGGSIARSRPGFQSDPPRNPVNPGAATLPDPEPNRMPAMRLRAPLVPARGHPAPGGPEQKGTRLAARAFELDVRMGNQGAVKRTRMVPYHSGGMLVAKVPVPPQPRFDTTLSPLIRLVLYSSW